ncbi:hypothetical protein CRG98_030469, partial [Punica granatum]
PTKILFSSRGGEAQETAKTELIQSLKVLEGVLANNPFLGGDSLGFVDIALVPYYTWFHAYETCGNFSIEAECPKLISWVNRCMEKESVASSLADPEKVCEFVLQLKEKFGIE